MGVNKPKVMSRVATENEVILLIKEGTEFRPNYVIRRHELVGGKMGAMTYESDKFDMLENATHDFLIIGKALKLERSVLPFIIGSIRAELMEEDGEKEFPSERKLAAAIQKILQGRKIEVSPNAVLRYLREMRITGGPPPLKPWRRRRNPRPEIHPNKSTVRRGRRGTR